MLAIEGPFLYFTYIYVFKEEHTFYFGYSLAFRTLAIINYKLCFH